MNLKEFKEKIAESPNFEWYERFGITVNYPQINFSTSLKGVVSIYEFILRQIEGFNALNNLPQELTNVKISFANARKRILELLVANNIYENYWNDNLIVITNNTNPVIFLFDSPETEFLIRINQEFPAFYPGAYEYLTGPTQHASNKEYFTGYMMAYEFTSKDLSSITERKDAEKKSMSRIRGDFQRILGESENHLTDYLAQANKKYIEFSEKIDVFKTDKEAAYTGWFEKTTKEYKQFHFDADKKIKDLEDLYKEKLKLEAPAQYWSDRAKKLRTEGNKWLAGLIIAILVGIGLLVWCLAEISAGTLDKIFQNNGTAIKWSVVFITLISFIAFAIKIFSKLTFSSYHLVRDAEEREQLTYVYLALKKEKNIDETERHLIMQSLFSRADSGLLKDDAGPTMPGNIANNMISK